MEKLALGAVQLGLPYGAANETGMPSVESSTAIVEVAVRSSVPFVDTAAICEPPYSTCRHSMSDLTTRCLQQTTSVLMLLGMNV